MPDCCTAYVSQKLALTPRLERPMLFCCGCSAPVLDTTTVPESDDENMMRLGLSLLLTVSR